MLANPLNRFGTGVRALQEVSRLSADYFVGFVSSQSGEARVRVFDLSACIRDDHGVIGFIGDKRQDLKLLLLLHLFGDVGRELNHFVRTPGNIEDGVVTRFDPDCIAVLRKALELTTRVVAVP